VSDLTHHAPVEELETFPEAEDERGAEGKDTTSPLTEFKQRYVIT